MDNFSRQFGLVIAYLLPGFIALIGVAPLVPTVAAWLRPDQSTSFGAPIYAILAATAVGMVGSCFRWLIIDQLHEWSGVPAAAFNARALGDQPAAFGFLVEAHYRYYQFYSGSMVAIVFAYAIHRCWRTSPHLGFGTDLAVLILCAVLFLGSRDALSKYRNRSSQLTDSLDPHTRR